MELEEIFESEGMLDMFLYESFQLLEQMEIVIISEKNNEFFDGESIEELFRIMHTIKGSSGIMMYDNITEVAHKLEDIFYYMRETFAEDIPKAELTEYIFEVSDFMISELNKIKAGRAPDGDADHIVRAIDAFLQKWKVSIQKKGKELPPDNLYVAPNQYYIAPAADTAEMLPIKIDLGNEPKPGDYVIKGKEVQGDNLVGISIGKLEKLTKLVDKLIKAETNASANSNWSDIKKKIVKITEELENVVADMRKTSLTGTFRKMNRIVSDASRKLDKEIELKISGEELEVDRSIVEHISDPLMHIVRNAVDHGIEAKAERLAAGKNEKGKIVLKAGVDKNTLFISVRDDGRGIDRETVFQQAKQKGLSDKNKGIEEYAEQEIYRFITCPGLSTKETVTEYSGRGVGMDVVVKKLQEIGGNLEIESISGKGTEMTMEVPLL